MKKTLLALALAATLLLSGCGGGDSGAGAPGIAQEDLGLTIAGTVYRVDTNIETVFADFGEGYQYAEAMSCDYDGLDKTYAYDVAVFYTNPLATGDMVCEIYTESAAVTTAKGLAVGATKDEVVAAYGEDYEDSAGLMIYRPDGGRTALCFDVDGDGTVWAILLTNQSV